MQEDSYCNYVLGCNHRYNNPFSFHYSFIHLLYIAKNALGTTESIELFSRLAEHLDLLSVLSNAESRVDHPGL